MKTLLEKHYFDRKILFFPFHRDLFRIDDNLFNSCVPWLCCCVIVEFIKTIIGLVKCDVKISMRCASS